MQHTCMRGAFLLARVRTGSGEAGWRPCASLWSSEMSYITRHTATCNPYNTKLIPV